jgi:hypothetical protein
METSWKAAVCNIRLKIDYIVGEYVAAEFISQVNIWQLSVHRR